MICRTLGKVYLSTCGLILTFSTAFFSSHATCISQSKCPILHTIESSRISRKCFPTIISLQPVVVTKIWPCLQASSIVVT
uniref:Putative secreted protein n=1 Tax=Panstrongylus lignarius TaxID=156445 RepID=A0A224XWM4_9HEMI